MKSEHFIISTVSVLSGLLILTAVINIIIDPLFQYHKPWFNLEPVITDERYQNAGVAKNFDFDNAIIGNSLSENFRASWFDKAIGGKTAKLTAAASSTPDFKYLFEILKDRDNQPSNIIICTDTYILLSAPDEMSHELPKYLYDKNPLNDVSYLFNLSIFKDFTLNTLICNQKNSVPDIDEIYVWDTGDVSGKDKVLSHYNRKEKELTIPDTREIMSLAIANLDNITPYIEEMQNTKFIMVFSPVSILFWDDMDRNNYLPAMEEVYLYSAERLLNYNNTQVFFWNDNQMRSIITDLNNYKDTVHYNSEVSAEMVRRIGNETGILSKENYKEQIGDFFEYLNCYPYDDIFE